MTPIEIQNLVDAICERLASRSTGDVMMDSHGAAELLACSIPTVERLTKSGEIPSVKLGRLRRYRRDDLLALAQETKDPKKHGTDGHTKYERTQTASSSHQFAQIAILQLDRIPQKDPDRETAFSMVETWLSQQKRGCRMTSIQTYFEFAIEYRTPVGDEPNCQKILKGQVALLAALLTANDGNGTLDDATAKLAEPFEDSGKWRGQITLGLWRDGLIEPVGAENSRRRSRHRGLLRRWRLMDREKAQLKIEALRISIERLSSINTEPQNEKGGGDYGK